MSTFRKLLLLALALGMLAVIVLTWGSIGSAILTLALLISLGYILLKKILESRDPDDFDWEG